MQTPWALYRRKLRHVLAVGAAGWLAAGCSGAHEPAQRSSPDSLRPHGAAIQPTTNVPALLGKSIEGLKQHIGSAQQVPAYFERSSHYAEVAPRATDSVLAFRTGGLMVVAGYDIRTRVVHDLLLLGQHEDSLMQRGALRADASSYMVLPMFYSSRPGRLLGLRVIPMEHQ